VSVALQQDLAAGVARPLRIALVGSPNTGKTTLFNALTGGRSRVGNYPGVTVERREGSVRNAERDLRVLDLPGTYSLDADTPDEQVVVDVVNGRFAGESTPDVIVLVVDATTLERGLSLVHEVLHAALPRPCALAVTMIDELRARGGQVDFNKLARRLGIPVFPIVGHRGVGLDRLRRALERPEEWQRPTTLAEAHGPEGRFAWADALHREVQIARPGKHRTTERIDGVLLHPVAGTLFFGAVMVFVFQSIFIWAVPAMDAIEGLFASLGRISRQVLPAGPLTDLWTDGILAGVGSVLVFLPQIAILFTLIHLLEDLGYMARAAFVVDRVMGWFGLQGRSFVVLLSCYACAVPGIMAARTIPNPRDRLATILVSPFMTCSARLPVYTLLIAAFVPATSVLGPLGLQGLVMLALYVLGAATAIVSAALLKATIVRGHTATFFMDLPPYRLPTARLLLTQVWGSVRSFLKRAGTIIFVAALVVWALLSFPQAPERPDWSAAEQAQADVEASVAARLGRAIEPVIEPLGYDWRIGVGLIASLAAREIIVSTMAQIYAVSDPDDFKSLREALREDVDPATGERTFGLPVALSLLVFFVFALQCTSTIAVMAKETGSWRWPAFAFAYMFVLAYCGAFATYRLASALLGG
jgi:ferrous iron transport protein B